MKLAIKALLTVGTMVNHPIDDVIDTPDLDFKWSPIPEMEVELKDNGADGIVFDATAFGFLKTKRTLVSSGEHDFHVSIGSLGFNGSITIEK